MNMNTNTNIKRLWEEDSLNNVYKLFNEVGKGLGDHIKSLLEEAEIRHKVQMLELEIQMLESDSDINKDS